MINNIDKKLAFLAILALVAILMLQLSFFTHQSKQLDSIQSNINMYMIEERKERKLLEERLLESLTQNVALIREETEFQLEVMSILNNIVRD